MLIVMVNPSVTGGIAVYERPSWRPLAECVSPCTCPEGRGSVDIHALAGFAVIFLNAGSTFSDVFPEASSQVSQVSRARV